MDLEQGCYHSLFGRRVLGWLCRKDRAGENGMRESSHEALVSVARDLLLEPETGPPSLGG